MKSSSFSRASTTSPSDVFPSGEIQISTLLPSSMLRSSRNSRSLFCLSSSFFFSVAAACKPISGLAHSHGKIRLTVKSTVSAAGEQTVKHLFPGLIEELHEALPGGEERVAGGEAAHVVVHGVQLPFRVQSQDRELVVRTPVLRRELLRLDVPTTKSAIRGLTETHSALNGEVLVSQNRARQFPSFSCCKSSCLISPPRLAVVAGVVGLLLVSGDVAEIDHGLLRRQQRQLHRAALRLRRRLTRVQVVLDVERRFRLEIL